MTFVEAGEIAPVEVAGIADVDQVQKVAAVVHQEGNEEVVRPWPGLPRKEVVVHLRRNVEAVDLVAAVEELHMQEEAVP